MIYNGRLGTLSLLRGSIACPFIIVHSKEVVFIAEHLTPLDKPWHGSSLLVSYTCERLASGALSGTDAHW